MGDAGSGDTEVDAFHTHRKPRRMRTSTVTGSAGGPGPCVPWTGPWRQVELPAGGGKCKLGVGSAARGRSPKPLPEVKGARRHRLLGNSHTKETHRGTVACGKKAAEDGRMRKRGGGFLGTCGTRSHRAKPGKRRLSLEAGKPSLALGTDSREKGGAEPGGQVLGQKVKGVSVDDYSQKHCCYGKKNDEIQSPGK